MTMAYPIQMLLAVFTLLLGFPLATSKTTATTSKDETICDTCTPTPPVIECPPPPIPPSPPPPLPSPPPPACPTCPPCSWCHPPCILCPPPCSGCPPPPCNVCQVPSLPSPPPPRPVPYNDQPGVMGGGVYSPPNEVNPYYPYTSFQNPPPSTQSTASSINLQLKPIVSVILLLLSAAFSFF